MKFKNKLQLHIKECENKDFCEIIILFEDKKNIWILVNSFTTNKYVKDKKYYKVRGHCHFTGEYRVAACSICSFKYSVPKKIPIAFQYVSNYDNHFIIKELAEGFNKQFSCLGKKYWKIHNIYSPNWKTKLQQLIKMEKKPKKYTTSYQLLMAQELWQAHYPILSIILVKEFIN